MREKTVTTPAYAESARRIREIADNFDSEGYLIYKGRNTLRRVDAEGRQLVVKRYKKPNIFQRVAYTWFQPSKARRAFDYGARLLSIGIDTPAPAAWIERRRGGMTSEYFFFSEPTDATSMAELATDGSPLPADAADALARFLASMHSRGFLHGDLNLSNILFTRTDGGAFNFTVIDTNRSKWTDREPTEKERVENLVRLSHNRTLLSDVARRYAAITGLNPERFARRLARRLDSFEAVRERRARFKKILHRITGKK